MNNQLPEKFNHLLARPRLNADDMQPTQGIFDDVSIHCRVRYIQGVLVNTISKMWIEDEVAATRLEDWMRLPWGTYPDIPAKPAKKK